MFYESVTLQFFFKSSHREFKNNIKLFETFSFIRRYKRYRQYSLKKLIAVLKTTIGDSSEMFHLCEDENFVMSGRYKFIEKTLIT